MKQSSSGNLSKGDIISFISLLILCGTVFFGINFMTLGNRIPSIIVAVLLFITMIIFVFLAAYAKAQDRNQNTWKKVEYAMLGLYVVALIPCYLYSSIFFDVQLDKQEITKIVNKDINDINRMFSDYTKRCESRSSNYLTELEALLESEEGRSEIVRILKLNKSPHQVTRSDIKQAAESFSDYLLKGRDISALKVEKRTLVENCEINFKNWNILFLPQYALELSEAKEKYADQLERIYSKKKSVLEKGKVRFDTSDYVNASNIKDKISSTSGFSILGFLAILILGGLGLVKYILGEKSTVIPLKEGAASTINEDGGFTF